MTAAVLDHLVWACPDLDRAVEAMTRRLGVAPTAGGAHPEFGTRNALVGLGPGRYLEIIGPEGGGSGPARRRPFGIDGLEAGELRGFAVRTDRLVEHVTRVRAAGFDPGAPRSGARRRPDGTTVRWEMTPPPFGDAPQPVPFLIDWGNSPHPSAGVPARCRLVSLRLASPEPDEIRRVVAALGLDLPVVAAERPALAAHLDTPRGPVALNAALPAGG